MNCRFQDRMWSRYRQDKRGAFTLRETGQRGPTVTCSDGILSLPKPRFCDFIIICNGLRREFRLPHWYRDTYVRRFFRGRGVPPGGPEGEG